MAVISIGQLLASSRTPVSFSPWAICWRAGAGSKFSSRATPLLRQATRRAESSLVSTRQRPTRQAPPQSVPGRVQAASRGTAVRMCLSTLALRRHLRAGPARAQDAWIGEPRMARAAEQDFRLFVGDRVFFGDRSAELGSRARSLLAAQAQWLKQVPQATVIVEGHADDQGSAAFNQELAARRAQAVRDRLIARGHRRQPH